MTICSKCNKEKKTDFRKHRTVCRVCDNLLAREKRKKDKELTKTNKPSEILCKKCNKICTEFRYNRKTCLPCEREHGRKYRKNTTKAKEWIENNRERMKKLQRNHQMKKRLNPKWKEVDSNRKVISYVCIKDDFKSKHLDCTGKRLKNWILFQFCIYSNLGMTFENHGKLWEFDHVFPCKMYIDDKLPKNIVLSWLNIRPLLKQFNQSKKYELKKNDLISHLKNIQKYFRLHDLQIENDYVIELKKYVNYFAKLLEDRETPKALDTICLRKLK